MKFGEESGVNSEMNLLNEKTELSTFYNIKCKIVYLIIQNSGKIPKNQNKNYEKKRSVFNFFVWSTFFNIFYKKIIVP